MNIEQLGRLLFYTLWVNVVESIKLHKYLKVDPFVVPRALVTWLFYLAELS